MATDDFKKLDAMKAKRKKNNEQMTFSDAAIEQFLAVKSRASFVIYDFNGNVREYVKSVDAKYKVFRVFVWREASKKHIRVLDHKDKEVYAGTVDL